MNMLLARVMMNGASHGAINSLPASFTEPLLVIILFLNPFWTYGKHVLCPDKNSSPGCFSMENLTQRK
jgi:hypothetical protein